MAKSVRSGSAVLAALLALAAAPAAAYEEGVGFGLTAERFFVDLASGGETRSSRITLHLTERVEPWLTLGLHGGPALLTQSHDPTTAGMELTGFHVGVSARAEAFRRSRVGLVSTLSYTYQRTEGDEDEDTADARSAVVSLHEARAELAGVLRLSTFALQAGGYVLHLEGEQTVSGATDATLDLEADGNAGGFLQADLLVDYNGTVSLRLNGGAREAIALTFARQF